MNKYKSMLLEQYRSLLDFKRKISANLAKRRDIQKSKEYDNFTPAGFFLWLRQEYLVKDFYVQAARKFIANKGINNIINQLMTGDINARVGKKIRSELKKDGIDVNSHNLSPEEINNNIKNHIEEVMNKYKVHKVLSMQFEKISMIDVMRIYLLESVIQNYTEGYLCSIRFYQIKKYLEFKRNLGIFWSDVLYRILAPRDTLYFGEILSGGKKYQA